MTLSTPWSRTLRLGAPVLNAPMGGVAGGRMAAAVSGAGGLGMVGVGSAGSVSLIEREVVHPRQAGLSFGIGLLDWKLRREPALLDAAVAAEPTVMSISFGEDLSWVPRIRDAGIITVTQVFDVESARRAEQAGVEVLVARGAEGGGHGDPRVGTLPLLESVLDAVSLPVLAAGGVSSPRGLAAVLAAGASGAWLGTVFAACPESLVEESWRHALLRATGTDTVTTSVFDLALGHAWPSRFPDRILRHDSWEQWLGREGELTADADGRAAVAAAMKGPDGAVTVVEAGQGVGLVTESRPAADVVERLSAGAARLLGAWAHLQGP